MFSPPRITRSLIRPVIWTYPSSAITASAPAEKAELFDPAVADAAFALEQGKVSQPVKGRFGTVLLHVPAIEPGTLKALADALGAARDAEVMRARLADLIESQPAELVWGPVAERVDAELTQRYESGHEYALAFLSSERYFRLLDALDALPDELVETDLSHADAAEHITDLIARDWRRLRRTVRAADSAPDEEREVLLHDVRKAAKRLRYATESASDVLGKHGKQLAKAASAITEILGDHNDSMITQGVIGELAAQAEERGESTFTYGRIQGWEAARADISSEAYLDALRDVDQLRYPGWKRARPRSS